MIMFNFPFFSKLQNWMKNSLKINNTSLHDEVWDILAAADNVSGPAGGVYLEKPVIILHLEWKEGS